MDVVSLMQALLRGMHLAALLSAFGTLIFRIVIAPMALPEADQQAAGTRQVLHRITWISLICALVTGLAWAMVEVAVIAGAGDVASTVWAVPVVGLRTQFGHWMGLRLLLLCAAIFVIGVVKRPVAAAAVLVGVALAIQPLLGHAGALGGGAGAMMVTSEALHLLAAGAWLGGLLPLFVFVRALPDSAGAIACRGFTPIGLAAVALLAGTATLQLLGLGGGLPGLFGTDYGRLALLKTGLFLGVLGLAALNRLALTDQLEGATPDVARRHMRLSIGTETVLGAIIVMIAALLASQTPGSHQQPFWPFPWRASLEALSDPDLRREVVEAVIAVVGSVVLAGVAMVWRRGRWPLIASVAVTLSFAIPHLALLLVDAYPTSYFTSPTEFATSAIAHGEHLYRANCMGCHGGDGRGEGPAAKTFAMRPADLTAGHLWAHSDGDLFWFLSRGINGPAGSVAMPGFAGTLSSDARWHLIDYLHALNDGQDLRQHGGWAHPVPVPQFDAECPDGRTIDLDELSGRMVQIVLVSDEELSLPLPPPDVDLVTLVVARGPSIKLDAALCVAHDPETWTAFALLAGVSPEALAGTRMLADRDHWLRALWQPGDIPDPPTFLRALRDIAAHPLPLEHGGGHALHH